MTHASLSPFRRRLVAAAVAGCLLAGAGPAPAGAAEPLAGPVRAEVVRVIDGDTLTVAAHIWIGLSIVVNVRIRGIDAPELRGACAHEKAMAAAAKAALVAAVGDGDVELADIEHDKYAGRVVANVATTGGTDLAAHMLASGHARIYDGAGRAGWCDLAGFGG